MQGSAIYFSDWRAGLRQRPESVVRGDNPGHHTMPYIQPQRGDTNMDVATLRQIVEDSLIQPAARPAAEIE